MKFECDENKNHKNLLKHGISFENAALIFTDKNSLSIFDEYNPDDEERWITMGLHPNNAIFIVVHTYRKIINEEYIRIISARKATKYEMKQYFKSK